MDRGGRPELKVTKNSIFKIVPTPHDLGPTLTPSVRTLTSRAYFWATAARWDILSHEPPLNSGPHSTLKMRAPLNPRPEMGRLAASDIQFFSSFWNDHERRVSEIYEIQHPQGTTQLIEMLVATQGILRLDMLQLDDRLRHQHQRVSNARAFLQIQDMQRSEDENVPDTLTSKTREKIREHDLETIIKIESKTSFLSQISDAYPEITKGIDSLLRIAKPLLQAQQEQGTDYFRDGGRVARYTVASLCIDSMWLDLQTRRRNIQAVLNIFNSMEDPSFIIPIEVMYHDGRKEMHNFDVNYSTSSKAPEGVKKTPTVATGEASCLTDTTTAIGADLVAVNAKALGLPSAIEEHTRTGSPARSDDTANSAVTVAASPTTPGPAESPFKSSSGDSTELSGYGQCSKSVCADIADDSLKKLRAFPSLLSWADDVDDDDWEG